MKNFITRFNVTKVMVILIIFSLSSLSSFAQYNIVWTDLVNVTATGNTIKKTGGVYSYDAGAVSANKLPACVDGWTQCTINEASSKAFGFSPTCEWTQTSFPNKIRHGFLLGYGEYWLLIEGAQAPAFPSPGYTHSSGATFKVERVGNQIKYYVNNSLIWTHNMTSPASSDWCVAASIYDPLSGQSDITNATCNFAEPNSCDIDLWNRNNSTGALYNIYQSDNVGIGTLSPSERLDINGKARVRTLDVDNSLSNLVVADANGVLKKKTDPWTRDAANGLLYTTTGTDKLGIGTTTPTERLDVNGTARLRGIAEDNTLSRMLVTDANGVVKYKNLGGWFKQGTTTIPNAITDDIYTSGKVRIGQQLEVSSTISAWGGTLTGGLYNRFTLYADNVNGLLIEAPRLTDFSTGARTNITLGWRGGVSGITILPTGTIGALVGIGTATPTEALHINSGNIVVTTGNLIDRDLASGGTTGASIDNTGALIRTPSDLRLKENIVTIENNLDKILKLRPVVYNYINREKYGEGKTIGFIAQEVETIIPEVVKKSADDYQLRSLNYVEVIPVLTGAIKEQQEIITTQNQRIDQLEKEMEEIKAMIKNQSGSQPSQQKPGSTGSMNVVPNPTYGKTTVNYTISGDYANASVIVYNELGQKMGEYFITQKGNGSVEVDATSFAGGAYFCKLVVDENIREVKKFIVSK